MTPDIVVTHRVFEETLALLRKAGRVHAPTAERLDEDELMDVLSAARPHPHHSNRSGNA